MIPDALEPFRYGVKHKAAQELVHWKGLELFLVSVFSVAVLERDLVSLDFDNALVGDRDPMDVAREVFDDLLRTIKGLLGVYDPGLSVHGIEKILKATRSLEIPQGGWDFEQGLAGSEFFQELRSKDLRDGLYWKKKVRSLARDPLTGVGMKGARWDQAVQMDMIQDFLIPRMENGDEPEAAAQFFRGKRLKGFGNRLKQDRVNQLLVPERERVQGMRYGKDAVKILTR